MKYYEKNQNSDEKKSEQELAITKKTEFTQAQMLLFIIHSFDALIA